MIYDHPPIVSAYIANYHIKCQMKYYTFEAAGENMFNKFL